MKHALISPAENDRLCEVADAPFDVAPPLFWVECADEVTSAWSFVDGVFVPPVPQPPTPAPVPQSVTPRQARLALLGAGLLDDVEAAVTAAGAQAKIEWDYALEVRRDWPLLNQLATGIGLTSEQIDDLFRAAAAL